MLMVPQSAQALLSTLAEPGDPATGARSRSAGTLEIETALWPETCAGLHRWSRWVASTAAVPSAGYMERGDGDLPPVRHLLTSTRCDRRRRHRLHASGIGGPPDIMGCQGFAAGYVLSVTWRPWPVVEPVLDAGASCMVYTSAETRCLRAVP